MIADSPVMQAPVAELPSVGRKAPAPSGETKSKNTLSPLIFESAGKSTRSRAADSWSPPDHSYPDDSSKLEKWKGAGMEPAVNFFHLGMSVSAY